MTDMESESCEASTSLEVNNISGFETFDKYQQETFDAIRAGIKTANNLPTGDNYQYYTCFLSFNNAKDKTIKRILDTMESIVKIAGSSVCGNIEHRDTEEMSDLVSDMNDFLLDRANMCMDEESGILQNPEIQLVITQMTKPVVNGSWNAKTVKTLDNSQNTRLLGGKNVLRPQLMFKDKIDNSSKPWQPRIKEKPNSLKPLTLYLEEDYNEEIFNHPYQYELDRFEPPECQLKKRIPAKYKSLEDTRLVFIDTPSDLKNVLENLKNYDEIAVDLEHHFYRTFLGMTCLMQISTGDTDYLIDTLALRSELYQLNEIFTKPTILKVFHGADSDIQWLQRDLSLYVVNMFDTHQAAKQLNLPYLSLAYLLKVYCSIEPNKHFQLADWRMRPLPQELMKYAREDTHYLLYIKDILKNKLIEVANGQSNILKAVYDQSTEICKRKYIKPIWTEEGCMNMYRKSQKIFNNKQMYALKELHRWRDLTAREEDDSIFYVLPNHMLLNIAETLPREMQGILACCNPIPPLVRQNVLKLHKIILKAREQPLVKSIPEEDFRQRLTQRNQVVTSEVWIYSPHDIPSGTEARADLPCLLDKDGQVQSTSSAKITTKHTVTVFDTPVTSEDEGTGETEDSNVKKQVFISPFKRYKCVIPMIAEQEAKELKKWEKEEEEKRLNETKTEENNKECQLGEAEINESINRVYNHYKQVSESLNKDVQSKNVQSQSKKEKKKKKKSKLFLGEMPDRKRKRESDIANQERNESQVRNDDSSSTPTPSLNIKIKYMPKKAKQKIQDANEERKLQETLAHVQKSTTEIKSIRSRKKGEKKANAQLLKEKGMLPSQKFDYQTVDFSSFQGGSTVSSANRTQFQQPKRKNKERHRDQKWKKPKFNI